MFSSNVPDKAIKESQEFFDSSKATAEVRKFAEAVNASAREMKIREAEAEYEKEFDDGDGPSLPKRRRRKMNT